MVQQERQFMSENYEGVKVLATANANAKIGNSFGVTAGKCYAKGKPVKGQSSASKIYSFCGKNGHVVDPCFKKHEVPPYFKKGSNTASIHNVVTASDDNENVAKRHEESQSTPNISLTPEQYQCLLALFQQIHLELLNLWLQPLKSIPQIRSQPNLITVR